jgi:hypothetical protein
VVRISPFNQKVQGSILFSKFSPFHEWKWMKKKPLGNFFKLDQIFSPSMNGMDEKKTFVQFLQARCPQEKRTFFREKTKW